MVPSAGGPCGVLERLRARFVRLLAALLDARDAVLHRLPDRTVLLALELRLQVDGGFAEDLPGGGVVEERVLEVLDTRVLHRRNGRREVSDRLEDADLLGGRGQERRQLVGFL